MLEFTLITLIVFGRLGRIVTGSLGRDLPQQMWLFEGYVPGR
jgi:hypothetical protein